MKQVLCTICFLLIATAGFSQAGASSNQPATVASVLQAQLANAERTFVLAVEAIPADKLNFVPTNGNFAGVRNLSQLVKHTASGNYMFCSPVLGEKPPVDIGGQNGPDAITAKDDITKYTKDSFAYCNKVYGSVNEKNMLEPIKAPFGNAMTTRLALAIMNIGHINDEYGQIVEYLRMNGIVPPATQQMQQRQQQQSQGQRQGPAR